MAPAPGESSSSAPQRAFLDALALSPLLSALGPEAIPRLLRASEIVEVQAGEVVVREGETSTEVFFILSGEANLRRGDLPLKTLGPGGHLGALGFLTGRPRTVTVTAQSTLTLARIDASGWQGLAEQQPQLVLKLVTAVLLHARDELVEMTDQVGLLLQGRSLPRARTVELRLGAQTLRVPTGTLLRGVLPAEVEGSPVVAALLNQKPVSLQTPVFASSAVEPLTTAASEGRQVWARTLGLVLLEAAHELAPELEVRLGPSRGAVQLVDVVGPGAPADLAAFAARLLALMGRLVAADVPVRQELWAVEEAAAHLRAAGWDHAARLLATWRTATVPMASCGKLYALGLGTFLPSTGALRGYGLRAHGRGLVLDYGHIDPRNGFGPSPLPEPGVDMASAHVAWLEGMGVRSAGDFNDLCISDGVAQLIRVAEGFHEKRIGALADDIAARRGEVRIISIAGPSSSGKTTFIKRLTTQLVINGLRPVGISLDDYYVDRERNVRDEHGEYDFEALEAIDLALLHEHVRRLLLGEEVKTARYDFRSGKSAPAGGPLIQLRQSDVLMLEGIHGVNPALLGDIPRPDELFRVFIHPMTTLPFDRLSRTSATDLRLLRRIVRDRYHRGYKAEENILRWPSVQRGERKHIFPFQPAADAVFDSALVYEPSVLKVYAERYLLEVPQSSPAYGTAWRLRMLIDRYVSIYPEHVPPTSIAREFIGGSGFEY